MKNHKLGFLSSLLCRWQSEATLIGKSVLPVFLVIRLVILGAAGQTAWLDDEAEFHCNTQQMGCQGACFNLAVPLSPAHLWTLQLVLVLAPGLVFLCYLMHLSNQENQVRTGDGEVKGHARTAYLACVASVILVEVGFVVAQSLLYGFWVNTHYSCSANPCPHIVDCVLPRAWENTVFLIIMFTASCVSLLLNVVEGVCVLLRAKPWHRQPDSVVESLCFLSQLLALWHSHASLLGKTVLPVLQLIRLVIVGAVVQPVWKNDLTHFVCDTHYPGCTEATFNKIFPFSFHQYSTLQVGFAVGQALIFGFSHFNTVLTSAMKCTIAKCYASKSTEKTVLMVIVFSVACLSGLLTLVEVGIVLKRERPWEKRQTNTISGTSGCQMRSKVKEEADTIEENESCTKLNI